ncbi:hypothetical protein PsW64_04424 [Pseudovibrio sp. W64]|nr:hypothetical protein PsW64_04424 [Pseudovibrio sp. W64]
MLNKTDSHSAPCQSYVADITEQACLHILVHSPADNFPCCYVLNVDHRPPTFLGDTVGDLSKSDGVWYKIIQVSILNCPEFRVDSNCCGNIK